MSVTDFLWLSRLNSICWQSIGFKISLCPSRNKRRVFRGRWPITSSAVCTNPASPLFCFAPSPTQIMPNLSASALEPFPIEKSFFPEPSPLIAIVNLGSCFAIFLRFCCTRSSFSFGYVAAFSAPLEGLLSAWPEPVPGLPEGVHGFAPSANLHQPPYQNQYLLSLRRYTSHQADSLQLISPPLRSSRCAHPAALISRDYSFVQFLRLPRFRTAAAQQLLYLLPAFLRFLLILVSQILICVLFINRILTCSATSFWATIQTSIHQSFAGFSILPI